MEKTILFLFHDRIKAAEKREMSSNKKRNCDRGALRQWKNSLRKKKTIVDEEERERCGWSDRSGGL